MSGKRIGVQTWTALLFWAEDIWRHWRSERAWLLERCLRLEQQRDDWEKIARALARGLE